MKINNKKIRNFANNVESFIMENLLLKPHFTHFKQKIEIRELLYWIIYATI